MQSQSGDNPPPPVCTKDGIMPFSTLTRVIAFKEGQRRRETRNAAQNHLKVAFETIYLRGKTETTKLNTIHISKTRLLLLHSLHRIWLSRAPLQLDRVEVRLQFISVQDLEYRILQRKIGPRVNPTAK